MDIQPTTIQPVTPIVPTANYVAGQEFKFDPNQYLPQIQQQASAIYSPQIAQLEALQKIGEAQTEQTRIVTEEDFAKRMKQEREAINQRGAFFSGGAIANEQAIRTEQSRALNSINLQAQMDTINNLAQQGQISVAQAEYIQDQLSRAQGSAYGMWSDAYNRAKDEERFAYQKKQDEQAQKNWKKEYKLSKKASKSKKASSSDKRLAELEIALKEKELKKPYYKPSAGRSS